MSPTWRQRLDEALAAAQDDRTATHLQLATVDSDGWPANRTIVFRGFDPAGCLLFVTDRGSAKVGQLLARPAAEACWWIRPADQQFRLRGLLRTKEEPKVRADAWSRLSPPVRASFLPDGDPPAAPAPDNFVVVGLEILGVDWLHIGTRPHRRLGWRPGVGGWTERRLDP